MYRYELEKLNRWKNEDGRKPLIIRGARQTGKTWLMKEFGRREYAHTVYVNFDNDGRMRALFEQDLSVERIVMGIELYAGAKIDQRDTLLIFDEIQEAPRALAALKYFHENAPEYAIVCAGSLLGVALHAGTSFPVGKVDFLDLRPLSFSEFLMAVGKERLVELIRGEDYELAHAFHNELTDLLKQYYYIGGMPEVVRQFAQNRDFNEARAIQRRILDAYEQDFSKHAPNEIVPRLRLLWNSIPAQLAKESKRFVYSHIKKGARAREFELAMQWLVDCGLAHQVHRATAPRLPLKAYEDFSAFKLFLVDVGLLACMAGLRQDTLLDGSGLFTEFKGALTEQYVLQQLKTRNDIFVYYWTNERNSAEIDFLLSGERAGTPIPVEVKAEVNLQAKSLRAFRDKHEPEFSVRLSMAEYHRDDWLVSVPLYAAEWLNV